MTELDKQNSPNSLPSQNLNSWLDSMSSLLGEISTVEINTMIVDEIVEEVFIPYEVYQAIYLISPSYLIDLKIHPSLRDRYLRLRRQLELQYALLLTDENSPLYDAKLAPEVKRDLPLLTTENITWENLPCRLPFLMDYDYAATNEVLHQILADPNFRAVLRQMGKVKASLDRRNRQIFNTVNKDSDLTYIQTSLQLNGKIINRYASAIIEHPQQAEIIKLHQQGVESGEKQWRKLLQFLAGIMQKQRKY